MYLWKTAQLAEALKNNAIDEAEFKTYYVFTSIALIVAFYIALFSGTENTTASLTEAAIGIGLTLVGLDLVFKANRGNTGTGYLNKVTALSVPLMIKVFLLSVALSLPPAVLHISGVLDEELLEWSGVVVNSVILLLFYWRLITHIRATNA